MQDVRVLLQSNNDRNSHFISLYDFKTLFVDTGEINGRFANVLKSLTLTMGNMVQAGLKTEVNQIFARQDETTCEYKAITEAYGQDAKQATHEAIGIKVDSLTDDMKKLEMQNKIAALKAELSTPHETLVAIAIAKCEAQTAAYREVIYHICPNG